MNTDLNDHCGQSGSHQGHTDEPFGDVGGRDDRGRFAAGNSAALLTGARSVQFWQEHAEACQELVDAVLQDAGHTVEDAPKALSLAAQNIAQAVLIRDSAYGRLAASGGPMTSSGRVRRALGVWQSAADRVERGCKLIGLRRTPKDASLTPTEWLAARTTDEVSAR